MVNKKTVKNKKEKGKIRADMLIGDIIRSCPDSVGIMLSYGLHCVGCHVGAFETLEQGALAHGMSKKDIKNIVDEINSLLKDS